jgi:hypothetical protein
VQLLVATGLDEPGRLGFHHRAVGHRLVAQHDLLRRRLVEPLE